MNKNFNCEIAKEFGVNRAIFIYELACWVDFHRMNYEHYYDGRYWHYRTLADFSKTFPFWTESQIKRIISTLVSKGVMLKGSYRDGRKNWYTFVNEKKYIATIS